MRTIIGIAIAALVLFVWGFVYWGLMPYGKYIWKPVKDDDASAQAMRDLFPQNGTYFFPAVKDDQQAANKLLERGPVAMVHMIAVGGRPGFDAAVMARGFVLNLIVVALIAVLLRVALPALPTYLGRVAFVALAGLAATVLVDGGDCVWWGIGWQWKLYQAVYSLSFWLFTGLILAAFVRSDSPAMPGGLPSAAAPAKT
jgi:hypothetical protein